MMNGVSIIEEYQLLSSLILTFAVCYSLAQYILDKYCLTKNFFGLKKPDLQAHTKEFRQCISSVIIAAITDYMVLSLPLFNGLIDKESNVFDVVDIFFVIKFTLLAYVYGDMHFYFTHRLLHQVDFLYINVHKIHHESVYLTVWAGLSFHPIEALIFFSSYFGVPLFAYVLQQPIPFAMYRIYVYGSILGPILPHSGFSVEVDLDENRLPMQKRKWWQEFVPNSRHHYLHHTRFTRNYAGTPIIDRIFGTLSEYSPDENIKQS